MAGGRGAVITRRAAIIVAAVALSLWMEIAGYQATPPAARVEASYWTLHLLTPLAFAACAGVAWARTPTSLPSRLMVAFIVLWIPQSIYRLIGGIGWLWPLVRGIDLDWAVIVGLIVLVYPNGRFLRGFDRVAASLILASALVNLVAVVLLAQPGPATCDCVANPYAITTDPALFRPFDDGFRLVGVGMVLVIAIRLLVRWVRGSVPARTVAFLMPLALLVWGVVIAMHAVAYAASVDAAMALQTIGLVTTASIPISYVAGVAHAQNMRARVADLMRITREGADRGLWAESLAHTLRDSSVRVYWWDDRAGRYSDAAGVPIDDDADPKGSQSLLPVSSPAGVPIALIRHDRVLTDNARLLEGVSSALRLSVDNGRLRSEIERTLDQVKQSRQRIVEAGVEARRRLERNLHDGAQQQLVGLGMTLRLIATEARAHGDEAVAAEVDATIEQLNQALRDLRELAHGIHPSLLSQGGLELALPELAGRCPVPTEVDVARGGRLPEVVESTAYFVVAESLANIAKHAGATRAWVSAQLEGRALRLIVRDNGAGGASLEAGTGMLGMADRVDAVGGTLTVVSEPGAGTTIDALIPLDGAANAGVATASGIG